MQITITQNAASLFCTFLYSPNAISLWNATSSAIYSKCKLQFTYNAASFFCYLLIKQPVPKWQLRVLIRSLIITQSIANYNLLIMQPAQFTPNAASYVLHW